MLRTKHLSIMFTDMKGFTTRAATQSREQLHHLLELQDEIIKPAISQSAGTIIKTIGDAFLVTFESPTDAVLCGMKIQENILNHNARATTNDQMEVRIAINSGEVNLKDNDVFGEPVNIAARIESIAEPNEVYFTEVVYLSMNKNEIPTAEVGYRKLKGIPEEIKVYKVVTEQTNLIRNKIKRQQLAESNANLSKDQVNLTTPEIAAQAIGQVKEAVAPKEQKKKSFWKRHKKKIIIIILILLFLIIVGNANKNKPAQQNNLPELYPSQIAGIKSILASAKADLAQAIENNDQKKINEILNELQKISGQNLPASLKLSFSSLIQAQLKTKGLNPEQKAQLQKILNQLK